MKETFLEKQDLSKGVDTLTSIKVKLDPSRCVQSFGTKSVCNNCVDYCPLGLIELGKVPVIRGGCDGCGICYSACPSGALKPDSFSEVEEIKKIAHKSRKNQKVTFSCYYHKVDKAINVTCLGALTEAQLLAPFAFGAEEVRFITQRCSGCFRSKGYELFLKKLDTTMRIASSLGIDGTRYKIIDEGRSLRGEIPSINLSRRVLLRLIPSGVKAAFNSLFSQENTLKKSKEEKINNLIFIIRSIQKEDRTKSNGIAFYRLGVDERCIGCGVCVKVCPTNALVLREDQRGLELSFIPERCMGCRWCQIYCVWDALKVEESIYKPIHIEGISEVPLIFLVRKVCSSCGGSFYEPGEQCMGCRRRGVYEGSKKIDEATKLVHGS